MHRGRALSLVIAIAAALGACDSPAVDTTGDAGPIGCRTDLDCPGALVCMDDVCQEAGCTPGTEGCACGAGNRCTRGSDGNPLVCTEAGVCSSPSCPAGEHGCVCVDGERCDAAGDACRNGYCVGADCASGEEGCTCLAGTCDANLHCLDGAICVDDEGYEGGPCLPNARCYAGALCEPALDLCVHCDRGSEGCACSASGTCNGGLACVANLCVPGSQLPPVDPVCYTPCRRSILDVFPSRVCEPDGLMDGCTGDLVCERGSCVAAGASPPTCTSDLDCPFFQTCLLGGCYSNCEQNLDCPTGLGCHERVCRVPCETTTGADPCGEGYFCDSDDGENGYCVQLSARSGSGDRAPATAPADSRSITRRSRSRTSPRRAP